MSSSSGGNSSTLLIVFIAIAAVMLVGIVIAFLILRKKSQNADVVRIENLRKGTQEKSFSFDVLYQKLYVRYLRTPFLKNYLEKVRRRVEINNLEDEFTTRKQSAEIITKALLIIFPLTILIILITHKNIMLMLMILIFELFIIDSFTDGMVNKLDNDLLLQQADFFAQIRHSYHECNMVGEAIYQTAQDTEHVEVARQAEEIYKILNSSDPEIELEKYYDIAPNNYLKEFAGISYLTQEFGDRKESNSSSLYLKNLENITQEMQLEILKRDKLNYKFQSLSIISIVPTIILEPLKNWATSNFGFTKQFYNGSKGMLVQILIMFITFICYILIRKVKDNGSTTIMENNQDPWQEKAYKIAPVKRIVDMLMPGQKSKEYRKLTRDLKDAGSHQKIRWMYVNKVGLAIVVFIVSLAIMLSLHAVEVHYIYTEPTSDYNLIGDMSEKQEAEAIATTKRQNIILDKFRGNTKATTKDIEAEMRRTKEYKDFSDKQISSEAQKIYSKLQTINAEYLKWFEVLLAFAFAYIGYVAPNLMLMFQKRLRKMDMEDEVMSFQTIIMMLMKIERVDVEMILEWLGRYASIFKDPIEKCLNNYESGAYEALEEMKDDVTYEPFIRIIESLQTSVEKVPIRSAFEELDSDREYYQDKRKEANERQISRKARIGTIIGFGPMVVAFVGYLIVPLVFIGMTSMMSSFQSLNSLQ